MHCTQCGSRSPDGSRFCEICGHSIQASAAQPVAAQAAGSGASPHHPPAPPPPQPYAAPAYHSPPPPQYQSSPTHYASARDEVMTFGSWMGMFFLLLIPFVNFILILVWAFGGDVNRNKQNFCRAWLVFGLLIGPVAMVLGVLGGVVGAVLSA